STVLENEVDVGGREDQRDDHVDNQPANSKLRALSVVDVVVGVHGDSGNSLGGFVGFIVGISENSAGEDALRWPEQSDSGRELQSQRLCAGVDAWIIRCAHPGRARSWSGFVLFFGERVRYRLLGVAPQQAAFRLRARLTFRARRS